MKTPSRRHLLQLSASTLLAANLWPGSLNAAETATKDFSFAILNDLHYMDDECGAFFQNTVVRMLKHTPGGIDFAMILGDLSENGTPAQEGGVKDVFNTLGVPYHVMPGNHDWNPDTGRAAYNDLYPKQTNYTFEHNGVQIVALDSADQNKYKDVAVLPETLQWLADNLPRLDKSKPTVLVTHFPMSSHTIYHVTNAAAVLDPFKGYNLQGIFGGHFHGFTEASINSVPVVTNKCCSLKRANHDHTPTKGYFLCQMNEGKLSRTFVEVPMPAGAATQPAKART